MERSMDIVRDILLAIEKQHKSPSDILQKIEVKDYSEGDVIYHLELMINADLVRGNIRQFLGPGLPHYTVHGLTWDGHEFLDSSRSQTIWTKTMDEVRKQGVGLNFKIIQSVMTKYIAASLVL